MKLGKLFSYSICSGPIFSLPGQLAFSLIKFSISSIFKPLLRNSVSLSDRKKLISIILKNSQNRTKMIKYFLCLRQNFSFIRSRHIFFVSNKIIGEPYHIKDIT